MKDLKWPAVVVILGLLAVLGFLSYQSKDATTVLAGVIAVLGALGFGYQFSKTSEIQERQTEIKNNTEAIREQTNGRITEMMGMLDRQNQEHRREMAAMADRLAQMIPPSTPMMPPTSGIPTMEGENSSSL